MLSLVTAGKPRRAFNMSVGRNGRFRFGDILRIKGNSDFGEVVIPEAGDALVDDLGNFIVTDTGENIVSSGE